MKGRRYVQGAALFCLLASACGAQSAAPRARSGAGAKPEAAPSGLAKSTEEFLRRLYAWGPAIKVKLGAFSQSPAAEYYLVPVEVTMNDRLETGSVFVSKDGRTLLRGEIFDMAKDPFAANRAKLDLQDSPSKGPANARVTVVEFSDFECPHCQELYESLETIEPRYPQVRFVHKDFPLAQIHPWAETAAIGGRCAYEESSAAFWKVYGSIFQNQDLLSAENIWEKLIEFAKNAGLNADAFKACLSSPEALKAVDTSHAEGVALGIDSTPTVYVNGRPLIGGDPATLEQYIKYELTVQAN